MMKKFYLQPNTEIVLLHADSEICDTPVASISEHINPKTVGKPKIPGVSIYRTI